MIAFSIFLIGYTLSQFYRSFLAVIAPELAADLNLDATDLGNCLAAWFGTFAMAQFAVGAALDRFGPRRTLPVLMMVGVVGALAFAKAHNSTDAIVAMGLIGIGCSPALMGPMFVFARSYAPERFAMLASLMIGFGTFGNLMGGTPLALASEAYGWRAVFYGLAGVTLCAAALIALLVKDPPRVVAPLESHANGKGALLEILSIRALWPVWPLMALGYGVLIAERGIWVGPYLADVHGLDAVGRGHTVLIMAMAIAVGALSYGPIDRIVRTHRGITLWSSVVAAIALLALSLYIKPSLVMATVLLSVFGFAAMNYGVIVSHIRDFLPEHVVGRGLSFANFLCMGGAGVLQAFSGYYVRHLQQGGLAAEEIYSALHFALFLVLALPTAVYALSSDKTPR
ncbi:MAG: MFS transporter [Hyphomicrobium sp.]